LILSGLSVNGAVGSSPAPNMSTSLLAPAQWAQSEFALAELGDRRLTQRLVQIGTGLALNPGGTLPQAFPMMKNLKAAHRFFQRGVVIFIDGGGAELLTIYRAYPQAHLVKRAAGGY